MAQLTLILSELANSLSSREPKLEALQIADAAVSLFALGARSASEARELTAQIVSQDLNETLYQRNLNLVISTIDRTKPTVAILLHDHADFYNQQQTPILKALREDSRFNTVVVVMVKASPLDDFQPEAVWMERPVLFLPRSELLEGLDWIDVVITLDFCAPQAVKFPPKAKRICQPHGMDIKFQYSVEFYGAGLLFDYLLAPSFAPEILPDNYRARYYNVFPRCLIDHCSNELRIIPFGSPKLDDFIRVAESREKTDIIYNISYWGLESEFVHTNLAHNIETILREFPERRLVFRCFPGEQDILEPIIKPFRTNPRFFVSTASSYIQDYASGAVLIYHRGSSADVFALSTGSPVIRFDGHDTARREVTKSDLGYIVYTIDDLVKTLRTVCDDPGHRRDEILAYRSSIIPHAGRALPYLLDCICDMLRDEPRPEWKRILLHDLSDSNEIDLAKVRRSAQICKERNYVIPMLAARAADSFPSEPTLSAFATTAIFEHIYPSKRVRETWILALEYFARYLEQARLGSVDNQLKTEMHNWMLTVFPERFIGTMSHAFKHCNAVEMERLKRVVELLPLDTLDPLAIPHMLREVRDHSPDRSSAIRSELAQVKQELGIELLKQGRFGEAERVLHGAFVIASSDPQIAYLLAHAYKGQSKIAAARSLVEMLVRSHPESPEAQSLLDELSAMGGSSN